MSAKYVKMTEKEFIDFSNREFYILDLKADLKESLRLLDSFVTVTYTAETILDANNLLKKLKGAK